MLKLGLKPVTGVSRVTIKRTKNVSHYILLFFTVIYLEDGWLLTKLFYALDSFLHLKTRCLQESKF